MENGSLYSVEHPGAKHERGRHDLACTHPVDAYQIHAPGTFWKAAGDALLIDHHVAQHDSLEKLGMQIGLRKTRHGPHPDLGMPGRQQCRGMLKLLRIRSVGI